MRILAFLLVFLFPAPAAADRVIVHDVGDPGHVDIYIHPDHVVTVTFDAKIIHYTRPPWRHVEVKDNPGDVLLIRPRRARSGTYGTLHVRTSKGEVVLRLMGASSEEVASLVQIRHKSTKQVWDEAVDAKAREIADEETRDLREELEALREALARSQEKIRTASLDRKAAEKDWLSDYVTGPLVGPVPGDSDQVGLHLEQVDVAAWGHRRFVVFKLLNYDDEPYWVGAFQIFDQRERRDHAGEVLLGPREKDPPEGVLAIVPSRMWLSGIAEIRDFELFGESGTYVVLSANGRPPLRKKTGVLDLTPLLGPPPPPPDPEEGVVTVSVKGTYGAIWLGDGAGQDRSQATSVTGLGVGISYGFNRYIALEADIMGASTGEARFADVPSNGAEGELVRSAWLGRAQFGGALRVGSDWYQPVVRVGVGLQGASHSAHHEVNGVRTDGPDLGFDFDGFWYFGAGLDLLLGGGLRAGIAASGVMVAGDLGAGLYRGAIEAGAHIGLRWN